tara:strand:+ start:385 stop:618 length:234 start_codon:yes stop_codon:yes gene_type:complete
MADLEIDKMIEHPDFVSLETIKNELQLEEDNFQLWYLYRCYNKNYLEKDELERLDNIVDEMRTKSIKVNKYNLSKLQ